MPACAIAGCKSHNRNTKGTGIMHHIFPRDTILQQVWLSKCCRKDKVNVANATICSLHFCDSDYVRDLRAELLKIPPRRVLKPTAAPSLNLPSGTVCDISKIKKKESPTISSQTRNRKRVVKRSSKNSGKLSPIKKVLEKSTDTRDLTSNLTNKRLLRTVVTLEARNTYLNAMCVKLKSRIERLQNDVSLTLQSLRENEKKKKQEVVGEVKRIYEKVFSRRRIKSMFMKSKGVRWNKDVLRTMLKKRQESTLGSKLVTRHKEMREDPDSTVQPLIFSGTTAGDLQNTPTAFNKHGEKAMELDLSNHDICRLCGFQGQGCVEIYSDAGESRSLQQKITVSAHIFVLKDDMLPKKVCVQCCDKLDSVYEFQESCKQVQEKLCHVLSSESADAQDDLCENETNLPAENLRADPSYDSVIIESVQECVEIETSPLETADEDIAVTENIVLQEDEVSRGEGLLAEPSILETFSLQDRDNCLGNSDGSAELEHMEPKMCPQPGVVQYLIISTPGSAVSNVRALPLMNLSGINQNETNYFPLKFVQNDPSAASTQQCEGKEGSVDREKENIQKQKQSNVHVRVPRSNLVSREVEKLSSQEYKCRICDKKFRWKHQCEYHIREHLGVKQFRCSCGKTFPAMYYLKRHEIIHNKSLPFLCHQCGKSFRTISNLRAHERRHNTDSGKFLCNICGQKFFHKQSLNFHVAKHTGTYEHICEVCGTAFIRMYDLLRHIKSHHGGIRYQCSTCGKSFLRKYNLKKHALIHTRDTVEKVNVNPSESERHACSVCGKSFLRKSNLEKHSLKHNHLVDTQ